MAAQLTLRSTIWEPEPFQLLEATCAGGEPPSCDELLKEFRRLYLEGEFVGGTETILCLRINPGGLPPEELIRFVASVMAFVGPKYGRVGVYNSTYGGYLVVSPHGFDGLVLVKLPAE